MANNDGNVKNVVSEMEAMARQVLKTTGLELKGLDVLDVGPGQLHGFMHWLAVRNRAIGIDLDISPQGFHVGDYLKLLRNNGFDRFAKTVVRKTLGTDRRFHAALAKQMQVPKLQALDIRQMDATEMDFSPSSFDFVFSRSVFEHIDDPLQAAQEVVRVLRPTGATYIVVHPYSADGGCHDPRIMFGDRAGLPHWAHLRPETTNSVRPNSFLNKVRLERWREIFLTTMPGCEIVEIQESSEASGLALKEARAKNQLQDYSDEELLTTTMQITWSKPQA